jgi:hypothetical protein
MGRKTLYYVFGTKERYQTDEIRHYLTIPDFCSGNILRDLSNASFTRCIELRLIDFQELDPEVSSTARHTIVVFPTGIFNQTKSLSYVGYLLSSCRALSYKKGKLEKAAD